MKLVRNPYESAEQWSHRRNHIASQKTGERGRWSELWAKRVLNWDKHVHHRPSFNRSLLRYHNENWLVSRRLLFVVQNGTQESRNTPAAGRTGTRKNNGKPQPRWEAGVALANAVCGERKQALRGNSFLSVGTIIRNASLSVANRINEFFGPPAE